MSIYATNFIVDEETGESKLIKHLNQSRIDRCYAGTPPGKWNRQGKKARLKKKNHPMASLRVKSHRYKFSRGWNSELYVKFRWDQNEI